MSIKRIFSISGIFIFFLALTFSFFLMYKTFQVTPQGNLKIASKAWSDFAATVPLIRSFSLGSNFPPEYPLFAGPPIRYHFLFYLIVGFFEKAGLRLDFALNIPSAISFLLLILIIYFLGTKIFKKKSVGILSVVLFLFNGSLSFLEFLKTHPLLPNIVSEITKAHEFSSFGPYDGKIVSAFWSLNIFTNQRHLAIAYAAFLLLVFLLYKLASSNKKFSTKAIVLLSLLIGLFPFFHLAVFGMMLACLGTFFLTYPKVRYQIFLIGLLSILIAIPQILYMGRSQIEVSFFDPGYLIQDLNLFNFVKYWVLNLGLTIFLAPIGFALAPKSVKKIFLPFLALFVIGNLFRFSPEVAANHKFFNLFLIGANFFTAYALLSIWEKKVTGKVFVSISLFFLTFSGVIDIFPILNDGYIEIADYRQNPVSQFIFANTPKESVFLNSSFLYHPASLAGRKIFIGWPYFPWSAGYDTNLRGKIMAKIYSSHNKQEICELLRVNDIDYFTVEDTRNNPDYPIIDVDFFEINFKSSYKNSEISVFQTDLNCN